MSEPLSEEQLTAIRERDLFPATNESNYSMRAYLDRQLLLEEVERLRVNEDRLTATIFELRAENAAMRQIVQAAAAMLPPGQYHVDYDYSNDKLTWLARQARTLLEKEAQ